MSYPCGSCVHKMVQRVYGNLLHPPLSERRRDPECRKHHLLAAPDRPEVCRCSRRSRKSCGSEESPSTSPSATVPPMDEVGETRLALLVDRLDTEHLGGGSCRGGARWTSSQLHLDRTRDGHHSRPGHSGEDTLA